MGEYQWKSYKEVFENSNAIARYLLAKELCPKFSVDEGVFRTMAIYAKNREEWVISDMACALTNITVVPLYDTLGKDSIVYILDQT